MELKELTKKQLNQVLKKDYKENFPRTERKSSMCIKKLHKGGNYFCYGAFENEKLLAFLFFLKIQNDILFDYFAVCGDNKNKGIGGAALELFKKNFSDCLIIGEIEIETPKNQTNAMIARRTEFYKRHNMFFTDVYVSLWYVPMQIITFPKVDKQTLLNKLHWIYKEIYEKTYGAKKYKKLVSVDIKI